ncbi:unnamed protein product [Cyprideis torosa]|uniref:CTLH domain-containing protein n=1 Tax=Cyprideis torosa TaxID=163714 RepID=A0A7R8ZGL0_9CRUS|nr:unnamed protein product [Cyprideis torosa]CAG0880309.1 unnamed protein product [Cyprideis torosa]
MSAGRAPIGINIQRCPKDEWMEGIAETQVARSDINALVMEYLVTEGFKEAAEKFREEAEMRSSLGGMSNYSQLDMASMDERIKIRQAVQSGNIKEAIRLVNQGHPELLDDESYLHFHLQQQHLIELIREGKVEEALTYAQTHLSERGEEDPSVLPELERTLALLAFETPEESPFANLLHPSHRQKVASELNAALLKLENHQETMPKMTKLFKLILFAQNELDKAKVQYPKMDTEQFSTDLGDLPPMCRVVRFDLLMSEDEYEESYVFFEVEDTTWAPTLQEGGGSGLIGAAGTKASDVKIIGLETGQPVIQIKDKFFRGSASDAMGTHLHFQGKPADPPPADPLFDSTPPEVFELAFVSHKLVNCKPVFITPKMETVGEAPVRDQAVSDPGSKETNRRR